MRGTTCDEYTVFEKRGKRWGVRMTWLVTRYVTSSLFGKKSEWGARDGVSNDAVSDTTSDYVSQNQIVGQEMRCRMTLFLTRNVTSTVFGKK